MTRSTSPAPTPTSPKTGVIRFLRKSTDVAPEDRPQALTKTKSNDGVERGRNGFKARFLKGNKSETPAVAEEPLEADAAISVAEDGSARDVGLPNGTRFVEDGALSRSVSRKTQSSAPQAASADIAPTTITLSTLTEGTTLQRAIARRIQNVLSSVPPFYGTDDTNITALAAKDDAASEAPPDASLLEQLSSTTVMSGTWAILDKLVHKKKSSSKSPAEAQDAGLMIYGPLIIDSTSTVELARYSIVSQSVEVTEEIYHPAHAQGWWPPFGKHDPSAAIESVERRRSVVVQDVKVFYPSLTKISIKCAWWGFRIYLPPPVMAILDQESLQAAQRAAMITTALTWIVQNIPVTAVPPPLAAVLLLLKAILPFIGYVGGFIAWSWGQIKGFDKGDGVVLSATWLLPIALIPGAWDAPTTPPPEPEPTPPPPPPAEPAPAPTPPAPPAPAEPPAPAPAPAPAPTDPPATTPAPNDPTVPAPVPTDPASPDAPPTDAPALDKEKKRGWFGRK